MNTEGETQARELAQRLRNVSFAAVLTSPLGRAVETARAITEGREISPIVEDTLREVDFGSWDNRTFADLSATEGWRTFHRFRSGARYPGGEMMIEVQARIVALLERSTREFGDAPVAFVSHADVIRCAVCHYLAIPLDLALRVRIDMASVTTIRLWTGGVEVLTLNEKNPASPPSDGLTG